MPANYRPCAGRPEPSESSSSPFADTAPGPQYVLPPGNPPLSWSADLPGNIVFPPGGVSPALNVPLPAPAGSPLLLSDVARSLPAASFCTKAQLYDFVCALRSLLRLTYDDYPLDLPALCQRLRLVVESHAFSSRSLCALAMRGSKIDTVMLNASRTPEEQHFDLAHELIHLAKHYRSVGDFFKCFETRKPAQDPFLEWQANEGAAELLLPYRLFLPMMGQLYLSLHQAQQIHDFVVHTAARFSLTPAVVRIRMESLKHAFYEYLCGVPLDQIHLYSRHAQQQLGIRIGSLNDLEQKLKKSPPAKAPLSPQAAYPAAALATSAPITSLIPDSMASLDPQSAEIFLRAQDAWLEES